MNLRRWEDWVQLVKTAFIFDVVMLAVCSSFFDDPDSLSRQELYVKVFCFWFLLQSFSPICVTQESDSMFTLLAATF